MTLLLNNRTQGVVWWEVGLSLRRLKQLGSLIMLKRETSTTSSSRLSTISDAKIKPVSTNSFVSAVFVHPFIRVDTVYCLRSAGCHVAGNVQRRCIEHRLSSTGGAYTCGTGICMPAVKPRWLSPYHCINTYQYRSAVEAMVRCEHDDDIRGMCILAASVTVFFTWSCVSGCSCRTCCSRSWFTCSTLTLELRRIHLCCIRHRANSTADFVWERE
jgi:hypothetical protein